MNKYPGAFSSAALMIVVLLTVTGCSTKKNTWSRRAYHNLTAHYNVYWNGMDNLRTGVKELKSSVKDNYALVIPVYNFGDKTSAGKMGQYSDIGIKKASKTIQKHSMYFNKREYCNWIDDAYMLIGKSYFYKQDFGMARRTFEFVVKTYNYEEKVKYDAMLWMALSSTQALEFNRAEPMLDMVMGKINQGTAPERLEKDANLIYAQFYILQRNYPAAVPYINRALELKPNYDTKTRCYFILAQVHKMNGEMEAATTMFQKVLKRNTTYDMQFNARISLAECYRANSGDKEELVRKMKRMLKDEKNKDFQDQIYYALSDVYLIDKDTTTAVSYLKKSVATSRSNNYQKAISALKLADIYFSLPDYPSAQAYYDSTMQFLPKEFPGYSEISKKTKTLTDLVTNLQVIQKEDSLQKLALLPENQRNAVIDKIIAKLLEEEKKKRQEEEEKKENLSLYNQQRGSTSPGMPSAQSGGWYFYNPAALSNGFTNFVRKWGRRKLEDLWFLTQKTLVTFSEEQTPLDTIAVPGDTTTLAGQTKKPKSKTTNPKDRDFYLKDLPFDADQVTASNSKIIQAYYNLGFIYYDGLKDYTRSIESFETMESRFPDSKYNVQGYYRLYQLYTELDNKPKSDQYKNLILTTFPETDYAKLIRNPEYYKELQSKQNEISRLYEDTYRSFNNQQYYMVINNTDQAMRTYPKDTTLIPKFEYLRALAIGKIEVQDSLVAALQKIITKYPKNSVRILAQNILDFINKQTNNRGMIASTPGDTAKVLDNGQKLYNFTPASIHFYVLIVDGNKTDVNALKIKIADFDTKYFDLDELQVNSILLDNNRQMVTVSNFDNSEKALNYFILINSSKYIFTKLESSGDYYDFVISVENYPIFYRNKDIAQYLRFFEKNYKVKNSPN